jgi:hypothetical protein
MIIFDLDGTLADCEHRRKWIVPGKNTDYVMKPFNYNTGEKADWAHKETGKRFVPRWDKFYEECENDAPIMPTLKIFNYLLRQKEKIQVWSGRSEVVREKTQQWLNKHTIFSSKYPFELRMRKEGDNTPDEQLKEMWLNEHCADLMEAKMEDRNPMRHNILFVFDDRPKVVDMWRRREIFVFNCHQSNEAF